MTDEQMRIDTAFAAIDWDGMMCFTQLQQIRGYLIAGSPVLLSPDDGFALMNTLEHALSSMMTECNLNAQIAKLHENIERIGQERDQMIAANVDLQTRLSACISALKFGEFVVLNSQRYLPGATGIERDAGKKEYVEYIAPLIPKRTDRTYDEAKERARRI